MPQVQINPTDAQLAARQNPTPATISTPTGGFSTDLSGEWLFHTDTTGQVHGTNVANLGGWGALSSYGINPDSLARVNRADLEQEISRTQGVGSNGLARYGALDLNYLNTVSPQKATLQQQTINATPPAEKPVPQGTAPQGQPTQALPGNGGQQTAPVGQATPQQNAVAGGGAAPQLPTTAMQPGNTGPQVQQLQDFLVSQGLMTQADLAGGYGTYGPKTTAAVAALQQKLGVDNTGGVGYFGPKTLAALSHMGDTGKSASGLTSAPTASTAQAGATTDTSTAGPYAGLDPIAKQVKMYTDAATALGLPGIKQQYESYAKQQADLQNELNDKKMANQNNPWLAQGLVDKMNQQLDDKYAVKLDTLTHLLTLTDSLYKQGQAQVESLVSNANADIKATNDLAQKQLDAATALAKDNQVVSLNGHLWLVSKANGSKLADLGPDSTVDTLEERIALAKAQRAIIVNNPTGGSGGGTEAERKQSKVDLVGQLFAPGTTIPGSGGVPYLDATGHATPEGWKTALAASSLPRADFIKDFGDKIVSNGGTVSSAYGLTPVEIKSLTGQ